MLTNPGFTFFGISGEHKIVPTNQTDLPTWGPNYTEAIICTYDGKLVKVYDNGPGFGFSDESVAMKFAAIDVNEPQQIFAIKMACLAPCVNLVIFAMTTSSLKKIRIVFQKLFRLSLIKKEFGYSRLKEISFA